MPVRPSFVSARAVVSAPLLQPYADSPRRPLGHVPSLPPAQVPSARTDVPAVSPPEPEAAPQTVLYYQRKTRRVQHANRQAQAAALPARRASETVLRWIGRRFGLLVQLVVANTVLCGLFVASLMVFLSADLTTALRYGFGVWTVCLLPIALLWSHYISTRRIEDE